MEGRLYYAIVIIFTLILVVITVVAFIDKQNYVNLKKDLLSVLKMKISTFIHKREEEYYEHMTKKTYPKILYNYNVLMERLKLDIPLCKNWNCSFFKWFLYFVALIVATLISIIIFKSIILIPPMFIIVIISIICAIYSITIKHRLQRMLDCIDTENLLAANIRNGFLLDVKQNLNAIPASIRKDYEKYILNVEALNFTSHQALQILDLSTGSFSSDFLKDVDIFENNRVDGFVDTFKDTAELNNIKKLSRLKMDDITNKITKDFTVAIIISYGSFAFELVISDFLRNFYFGNIFGQILLVLDLLLYAILNLAINILKSKEL